MWSAVAVVLALLATSSGLGAMSAWAADTSAIGPGLVVGQEAREAFEALARDAAVTFVDFEDVPTGPRRKLKLDGPAAGIAVTLRTTDFRYPLPPKRAPMDTPVIVLPHSFVSEPANHRLMGSNPGDIPDGQARYKLVLSEAVSHTGLLRSWNTNALTRFYGADGTLLAEHRNRVDQEFVGYVAAGPGDWVKAIEFDGLPEDPKSKSNRVFQVGEVDDLYVGFGSPRTGPADEEMDPLDDAWVDETHETSAVGESALQGRVPSAEAAAGEAGADRRSAGYLLLAIAFSFLFSGWDERAEAADAGAVLAGQLAWAIIVLMAAAAEPA